jgi:FG-GAP repeat
MQLGLIPALVGGVYPGQSFVELHLRLRPPAVTTVGIGQYGNQIRSVEPLRAAAFDLSGGSVASAGDVNGDGFDDVIVGARNADPGGSGSGASYVVFGKAGGFAATLDLSTLNGTTGFRLDGAAAGDVSGISVASAGDVNGDGFDDLIVGASQADPGGEFSGASYVVFGKAGGFAETIDLSSLNGTTGFRLDSAANAFSGRSVASAGDVNGDGFDDLIIGAPGAGGGSGASYVVYGKAGGFAATFDLSTLDGTTGFRLDGAASFDQSGFSVASAGDVNGDGFDDLIVGADSGASYVVFGGIVTGAVADLGTSASETLDIIGSGTNSLKLSIGDVLDVSEEPSSLPLDADGGDAGGRGSGATTAEAGGPSGGDPSRIDSGRIGGQPLDHADQALPIDTDIMSLIA